MSIRQHYWDPKLRRNVFKQVAVKKFESKEAAEEFLLKWKEEQIKLRGTGKRGRKKAEEGERGKPEETTEPIVEGGEEKGKGPIANIEYSDFNLKIAPINKTGTSTVIFGSSKSGKTTMLLEILDKYYNDESLITIMFADNGKNAEIYDNVNKNVIMLTHYDPLLIKQIHRIQKRTENKYQFLFVLDDIILSKSDPQLLQLLLTMRNAKISTIILLQSVKLLSKSGRFNGNNFIFRHMNNSESIEEIMKLFLSGYGPFYKISTEDKIKLYKQITSDYSFIYLDALNDQFTVCKKT